MNYQETKKFQEYIYEISFSILDKISNIFTEEKLKEAWEYIDSELCFRAIVDKLIGSYIDGIRIRNTEISIENFKDTNLSDFLNKNVRIKYLKLSIPYMGKTYGIEIKTSKLLNDDTDYKFDTRITILGSEISTSYDDADYDIRYFPITISKNPYNVYFLHESLGILNTYEYIVEWEFNEFPLDYNKWGNSEFIQQRLMI